MGCGNARQEIRMKVERVAKVCGDDLISIRFKNGGTLMVNDETVYPAESLLNAVALMNLGVVDVYRGRALACAVTPVGIVGKSIPVKEIFVDKNFLDVETSNIMGVCYDEEDEK